MLADADEIDLDLIREHRLVHEVADDLRGMQRFSARTIGYVTESIEPQFDTLNHRALLPSAVRYVAGAWEDVRAERRQQALGPGTDHHRPPPNQPPKKPWFWRGCS